MAVARGAFEVTMAPRAGSHAEGGDAVSRFVLDKDYTGDLTATGRGQMLASTTATDGSAGYVAIEVIEGTLDGLEGSFVVQHSGIMNRSSPTLQIPIIPDSGGAGLAGICGELAIEVGGDRGHAYILTYELPD